VSSSTLRQTNWQQVFCDCIKCKQSILSAIEFLKFNGVDDSRSYNPTILALLKADALMFYFVYADLTKLAKSKELNNSAFDMGQ